MPGRVRVIAAFLQKRTFNLDQFRQTCTQSHTTFRKAVSMKDPGTTTEKPVLEADRLRLRVASLEAAEAQHLRRYAELLESKEQYRSILAAAPS